MSDSVRPHRRQPTRLPRPWDSPGKNTGVGCHFLLQCMKVKSESEVAQSCPTLRDPFQPSRPLQPSRLLRPWIFQARVLEWDAIAFSETDCSLPQITPIAVCARMLSCFTHIWLFVTVAWASLSMGFSREEYWSGLSCPPLGGLPDPGIEPTSLNLLHWQEASLTASATCDTNG